jgi:hypothetical protein
MIENILYWDELLELDLPRNDFAIYGSCSLVTKNLKDKNSDIDIIVRKKLWNKLIKKHPVKKGIGIGNTKRYHIKLNHIEIDYTLGNFIDNVDLIIDRADIIDGYRFMNIEDIINLEVHMGREKDIIDLQNIKNHFGLK